MKRLNVRVEDMVYRQLKSILALEGITISGWVNGLIKKKLEEVKKSG